MFRTTIGLKSCSSIFLHHIVSLMCEHNMLAKLFSGVARPIYILEVFNLLLANTHHISELVYIFSHPLFHNYLLINFQIILHNTNLSNNSSSTLASYECIQYYIQLLKTVVTKLQSDSNHCTLLKLFCNSKYSSFPLMTNCIILAIKRNVKEELVRVTAQHCILQLVQIMAGKKVGEYYFSNIHMLIFFYEIISETIQQETNQSLNKDTTIKYIIDLLKAISLSTSHANKQRAFLLFFTILNNLLVFRFLKSPAPGLHLLFKLSNLFSQIQELQQMVPKYLTPIYFIFGKYLFNKYLNNVSLSSIILLSEAISQLSDLKEVSILKIIKNHFEKSPLNGAQIQLMPPNQDAEESKKHALNDQQTRRTHSRLFGSKIQSSIFKSPYEHILKQIQKYNFDNPQFFQLKQNHNKKSTTNNNGNWFFNFNTLFKKMNVFDLATGQYIKRLSNLGAVKYNSQQPIKFLEEIFAPTSIYVYQFLRLKDKQCYFFGQKTEDTEKTQISFNENRDQFIVSKDFFKVVLNMAELALCQIDSLEQYNERKSAFEFLQKKYYKKLSHPGQIYFLLHFRQYFQHSLSQFVCTSPNNKLRTQQLTSHLIKLMYKTCYFLQPEVSEINKTKIQTQILKIEKQLYSIIKQKGFQFFHEYLQGEKQKKMVQQTACSNMQTSMIKFDGKESEFDSPSMKKRSSNQKKKKSIFRSFKKQNDQSSPAKNSLAAFLKNNQTSKMVQLKMLHLQLLRYLLKRSLSQRKVVQKEKVPLFKIFEHRFVHKYINFIESGNKKQVVYEKFGAKFNSQQGYECSVRVKVNFDDLKVYCELLHKEKLILKCDIKQFNLSQRFSLSQQYIKSQSDIKASQKLYRVSSLTYDKPSPGYLMIIQPTNNCLEFKNKQSALQLINTINQLRFGVKQVKDAAILEYLNRENQLQSFM